MKQSRGKDTFFLLWKMLEGAKVFSKLDASSGYWQIPLQPESSRLTTFITPSGRFCFRRLPFGITSALEIFQKRMANLLKDQEGVAAIQDDIIFLADLLQNTMQDFSKCSQPLKSLD